MSAGAIWDPAAPELQATYRQARQEARAQQEANQGVRQVTWGDYTGYVDVRSNQPITIWDYQPQAAAALRAEGVQEWVAPPSAVPPSMAVIQAAYRQSSSPVAEVEAISDPVQAKGPGAIYQPFNETVLERVPELQETTPPMNGGNGLAYHAFQTLARPALMRNGVTTQNFSIPFLGGGGAPGGSIDWGTYFQGLLQNMITGLTTPRLPSPPGTPPMLPMPGGGGIPRLPTGLGRAASQAGRVAKAIAALGAMGIGAELAQQLILAGIVDVKPKRRKQGITAAQLHGFKKVSRLLSGFCAPKKTYHRKPKGRK